MSQEFDVIVIGAGQAGLAAGYHLQRAGRPFVILEAGPQPAGSWPQYYDSLKLFSPARYSSLPGMGFPGDPDHYPTRDEVIAYLAGYADRFRLPVRLNTRVDRVLRPGGHFVVLTTGGEQFRAHNIIAATGSFHRPYLPQIPGQQQFRGRIEHSFQYHQPAAYQGQRVVVVGAGNSAVQIAVELAHHVKVTLATREPVKFMPQRILGRDIHFWMRLSGFDTLPLGYWRQVGTSVGVLDTGAYQAAVAAGKPERRPMFDRFTSAGVVWQNGSEEAIDAVIFATGFRPNLEYLAGLGALDETGRPLHRGGVSRPVPGLYFVGLSGQRSVASATLRGVGTDAAYIVKRLGR